MPKLFVLTCCALLVVSGFAQPASKPLALHPKNPWYFLFRDKPTVLITSAEHYGSVLNLGFDFRTYLNTLRADNLNYTRIFSGAYAEIPGAFDIAKNTLAPAPNRFLAPWLRSGQPGFFSGGNKFDLNRWEPAYFQRLHQFVTEAGRRGIVVEMTFFSSLYTDDKGWFNSPLHPRNNINGTTDLPRQKVNTLENGNILAYQEKLVRKLVRELNGYDNVFFEIQNEPYADNPHNAGPIAQDLPNAADWQKKVEIANAVSLAWQERIAAVITDEEKNLPRKHLIAQNIANFYHPLEQPNPAISIFNFHYALPQAVWLNQKVNKVISFDESGFSGSADEVYRQQAWKFILAGGGLFNNLDYSFTTEKPDGTDRQSAPGGGSPALRKQLSILKSFLESFDLVQMQPLPDLVKNKPTEAKIPALGRTGKAYALYLSGEPRLKLALDLPKGKYRAEWLNVTTGKIEKSEIIDHKSAQAELTPPAYQTDIALKLVRI